MGRYAAQVDLFPTFRETVLFPSSHVKMSWTYRPFKMEPGVSKQNGRPLTNRIFKKKNTFIY
jgi:hypothetical protein